jgi:hypothetical protein
MKTFNPVALKEAKTTPKKTVEKGFTWAELQQIPMRVREKMIFGHSKLRGKALDETYDQLAEWLKGQDRGIDLKRYLDKEGLAYALLRCTPSSVRPVVMLCENPESSKMRLRLEFLKRNEVTLKRKDKVVGTFQRSRSKEPTL